jgi:hypothetical protein
MINESLNPFVNARKNKEQDSENPASAAGDQLSQAPYIGAP